MALTSKQQKFADEYLVDLNATKAATRAGYSGESAHAQGSRLLKNAEVRRRVDEALARRSAEVKVEASDILRELKRIGLVDMSRAFSEDGKLLPLHEMPEDVRRCIASVEVEELFEGRGEERHQVGVVRKVKMVDKVRGLELLGKHLGLYTEKVEHSGTVSIAVVDPYAGSAPAAPAGKKPRG